MKVALRKKALTGGRSSLYLDFYPALLHPDTGKLTRREFLGIQLFNKPKDELERRHNKETMKLAEHTRATRQIEIQNNQFGFLSEERRNGSFIDFFKVTAAKRVGTNSDNWYMGLRYFADYAGPDIRFVDLNVIFCEEYRSYLLSGPALGQRQKRISVNTAVSYFNKFKAVLKVAYKVGLLSQNFNDLVNPIKDEETVCLDSG